MELPLLDEPATGAFAELPNFKVLLINIDSKDSDHQKQAEEFLRKEEIETPTLFDPTQLLSQSFEVTEYPFHILINPKGEIVYREAGAVDWKDPEVRRSFIALLTNNSSGTTPETESSKTE